MRLSIVATLYQSAAYIETFRVRACAAAAALVGDDYEIILVNDGSPDESLELAIKLAEMDRHIVVVDLSRNFGHHKAMMAGLAHAKGEQIFLIDSDLEEDPDWLNLFSEIMQKDSDCDVVYGVQQERKGSWFERWSGSFFWTILNFLSGLSLPANVVTARLMTRRYVEALLQHQERELFIAGLWHITGFRQQACLVTKLSKGDSSYTLSRKITLLINSVTSFSIFPLVAIFYLGLTILFLAGFYTLYLIVNWLFFSYTMAGWTSIMVSVWLLGGLMLSCMGVIGIYLSRIFLESKKRPYVIVRRIYGRD